MSWKKEKPVYVLDDTLINKIAAGEIVDRPASVVKELIENALDAGADDIIVKLVDGGCTLITISDNGSGMSRDNALLSIQRHATSKIKTAEDLHSILTMGFRGEALAAVSSVSRFQLVTRCESEATGVDISIHGGKIQEVNEVGRDRGTTVTVGHLFYNVPARKKFLRAERTELNHAKRVFLQYALAYWHVRFQFIVDERTVYSLPAEKELLHRCEALMGKEFTRDMKSVKWRGGGIRVNGLAGTDQRHLSDRSDQYYFINSRPVVAPILYIAINEAYQQIVPKGRHPALVLFIELPPELIDVNVHPAKKEVRFKRPIEMREAVKTALLQALGQSGARSGVAGQSGGMPFSPRKPAIRMPDIPILPPFTYPGSQLDLSLTTKKNEKELDRESEQGSVGTASPWSWCRIIGQAGGTFVLLETEEGIVVMDPRAAHERVLYEKMKTMMEAGIKEEQGLLIPETVELDSNAAARVSEHLEKLQQMGFGIDEFGINAFIVDRIPACLDDVKAGPIIEDIAHGLEQGTGRGEVIEDQLLKWVSQSAVRHEESLTIREIEQLVNDLARCDMPYTSPRGKSCIIFMGYNELNRKFGRA